MYYIFQRIINFKNIKHMKRILFSVLVAIGVSLIAPQTAKAQNQIDNGYEIEVFITKLIKPRLLSFIRMV